MPPPVKHRMGPARSAGLNKGSKTLSMHRGAPPADTGARMGNTGEPTRRTKSRFLKSPDKPTSTRVLLAPPKKKPVPRAPLPPPKPKVVAEPKPRPRLVSAPPPPVVIEEKKATPKRHSPVPELTNKDRERIFGRFDYSPAPTLGNPERIRVDPGWVERNIVTIGVPELERLVVVRDPHALTPSSPGLIGLPPLGVSFHRLVAPRFQVLIQKWDEAGLLHLIKTWNGSYVPRFRRGQADKRVLSAHAWGSAFDINAKWNAMHKEPAAKGEEGSVLELVDIANENGWVWGGDFSDPMHFEDGLGASE